jgi:tubulin delta
MEAEKEGKWFYDKKCVYAEKRGSGNNWADGYLNHAPRAMAAILDRVRHQVERCDHFDGFLMLMSVAGGTGSGVGARLTEYLRDDYPHTTLVNPIVWPYSSGEVIVQDYNSLLTTAHLQSSCDSVILLQNEQFHRVCSQLLHLKEVALSDINKAMSHSLASALQPTVPFDAHHLRDVDSMVYGRCRLSALSSVLCPHPQFKFLSVKTIPQVPDSSQPYSRFMWAGLLKHLRQMLITDSSTDEGMDWALHPPSTFSGRRINTSLSNVLILRGNELDSADTSVLSDPQLYSRCTPSSCTCSVWGSNQAFNHYEKCCTLVSNSQSCVKPLENVCAKAWSMYSARAYVHQYEKYGFTDEDFMSSFAAAEQILEDYKNS